jgi:hypothetical protein
MHFSFTNPVPVYGEIMGLKKRSLIISVVGLYWFQYGSDSAFLVNADQDPWFS